MFPMLSATAVLPALIGREVHFFATISRKTVGIASNAGVAISVRSVAKDKPKTIA